MTKVYVALDIETSISTTHHGAMAREPSNDIYTIIYGAHPDNINVVHNKNGFKRSLNSLELLDLQTHLQTADYIVGHNLQFDLSYLWHTVEIQAFVKRGGKIWDCQVAEYLLTGQQHCFSSLKELQLKYFGHVEKETRISRLYKKGVGANKIIEASRRCPRLWQLYQKYCKADGNTSLRIMVQQWQKAKSENMLDIIELYNDYLLALVNMSCTGIQIDIAKCNEVLHEFQMKYLEHLKIAQNTITCFWTDPRLPEFNINSPDHKSAILFGGDIPVAYKELDGQYKNGNPKYKIVNSSIAISGFGVSTDITRPSKKSGLYCTDEKVINDIHTLYTVGELKDTNSAIIVYCENQKEAMAYKKAAKTYIQAFLDLSVDGILFPHYNNTQTATGRLSSSKPNLQNVSKRNKFGKVLHSLFIPPAGWVCVSADFNQLEIWTSAWLSKDEQLIKDLQAGLDLHIVRLQYCHPEYTYDQLIDMCKIQALPEWVARRSAAKTVSFQMAYGAMPKKVAQSTGLPLETVELIYEQEARKYPLAFNLGKQVQCIVEKSAQLSKINNIPEYQKKGKNGSHAHGDIELLPVFDKSGNVFYNQQEFRKIGFWRSMIQKKHGFLDIGRVDKNNHIRHGFVLPQFKNYPMQSTAADIQGATSYECMHYCLNNPSTVKMINEIHDSKWFYIEQEHLHAVIQDLKFMIEDVSSLISQRFGIQVPFKFPVEFEVGVNFGDMHKYDSKEPVL